MKTAILMLILQLGSSGADAYYTNRNMHRYDFVEHDPAATVFIRNTLTLSLSSAAGTAGMIFGERLLRHRGHARFARAVEMGFISGHVYGAATSATWGGK